MIQYTRFLRREFHDIKTNREEEEDSEKAMHIVDLRNPGRGSFIVPRSCGWKYVSPERNRDSKTIVLDKADFEKIPGTLERIRQRAQRILAFSINPDDLKRAKREMEFVVRGKQAMQLAASLYERIGFLKTTTWNLIMMLFMFELPINGDSISQALNLIQDGLDELQRLPDTWSEKELVEGGISVWVGGEKVAEKDLTVKESDLIIEEGQA